MTRAWLLSAALVAAGCTERAPFEQGLSERSKGLNDAGVRSDAGRAARANTGVLPGMIRIPAGELRFGTPADAVPRVAEEEAPGVSRAVPTFDIDEFPYPNERGAMPRTGVSREEAATACGALGKRLCTATEWERACKGPDQTTYPWAARAAESAEISTEICDLGRSIVAKPTGGAATRALFSPIGDRKKCVATTGVHELAGGPWEWTATDWNRGSVDATLGVLKGGNAVDAALVGRCANGLGRPHRLRYSDVGFRCCRSAQEPEPEAPFLAPKSALGLKRISLEELKTVPLTAALARPFAAEVTVEFAWRWTPVAGDSLVVASACTRARTCGITVLHEVPTADAPALAVRFHAETGRNAPGAVRDLDPAVLWIHPHAGPTVAVRILHYREGRIVEEKPENVVRPRSKTEPAPILPPDSAPVEALHAPN